MAINYSNDPYNQGLGNLNTGIMQTAGLLPEFMGGTSAEEDAAQDALEQIQDLRRQENSIKSLGEGAIEIKKNELKEIRNKIQDIKNQNKDFQEFKDIGGLTANANNIMSDANYGYTDLPEISPEIMQMLSEQQNYKPQYRIRDQLKRDFSPDGIPKDFMKSLGQSKDAFVEDIDSLYEGLGSVKNKGIDFASYMKDKGIDLGKIALRGIGNVIRPGLGFVADVFQRPAYPSDAMSRSFAVENYGNPYNYNMGSGNLTGKDPFGINTISIGGNYPGYYDQYARDYRAGKYSPTSKFAAQKYSHAQAVNKANQERIAKDFFVNDDSDGNDIINIPTVVNNTGNGGNNNGGGGSNIGGANEGNPSANKSAQGYSPHFARGGIASLWQR